MKTILLILIVLSLVSCASSSTERFSERAHSEQTRAYHLGNKKGTPDNINAVESANQNASKNRKRAANGQFPFLDMLFEILAE